MAQPPQGAVDGRCLHLVLNAVDAGATMVGCFHGKTWSNPNVLRKIMENHGKYRGVFGSNPLVLEGNMVSNTISNGKIWIETH